jgi:hypothetical protein
MVCIPEEELARLPEVAAHVVKCAHCARSIERDRSNATCDVLRMPVRLDQPRICSRFEERH